MTARRNDEFLLFVNHASPRLSKLAWALTGSDGGADDLLQEALVRTYAKWRAIAHQEIDPYRYARRIMLNLTTDSVRAKARRRLAESRWVSERSTSPPAAPATDGDPAELVARLTAHQRRVITCRFLEDMSVRDTADELDITENNVKVTTNRALAALRSILTLEETHG
ncbi:sigma-70 family RNA polymerase sigma factor [Occultella kanbiaonis]|uniref:sigma-70 family RNA polymerase sigma factor n=1 Tax=Occultella kanbiaonis TaxID=2675754 RepID=UPI0013D6453A|nr:sigma-70 family RNA polymerase sigma factor [Occultella kanbiaonis]